MSLDPDLPVVVFGFNRPRHLSRVLNALSQQQIERLLIFIDGPRSPGDKAGVEACRALARRVDWAPTELAFAEENHGLAGLERKIERVFERFPRAVFVEDDCLPMPGFYAFMRAALDHYADQKQIFSIGGYQPLPPGAFDSKNQAVVASPRFTCWGWASWRDRWQALLPDLDGYATLFHGLSKIPDIAGVDLPEMARRMAGGETPESWDVKVALACLHQRKIHLLATRGLVRNIGLDRSGVHGAISAAIRARFFQNRNLTSQAPASLEWPQHVGLDDEYAAAFRQHILKMRNASIRRWWTRLKTLARRYLLPGKERYKDLDLLQSPHPPLEKRALFSYIVYPFAIPRDDLRFVRHINIWHAIEFVRALNQMGYLVDAIDYRDQNFSPARPYDLFIGHGGINFEKIAAHLPANIPKLYFSTGSYWKFHNQAEQARFADLKKRRSVEIPLDRPIRKSEEGALRAADGILGIGNSFTRSTYSGFERVTMINGCSLEDATCDWRPKDDPNNRPHFLFYGSTGNVHKGLDLALEAFSGLEQHLWVMAPLEKEFERVYRRELNHQPNIHRLGWVQPRSPAFYRVMRQCGFCILPSCSEGQSQSVLEAMNQGLVPLVSRMAGVDMGSFGFYIEPVNIAVIRQMATVLSAMSSEEWLLRSSQARAAVELAYSEQRFSANLIHALDQMIPPDALPSKFRI